MSADVLQRIETAVVGAALLDEACRVVALSLLSTDDLTDAGHRAVWQALGQLRGSVGRIDWDTLLRTGDRTALSKIDAKALGSLGRGKTAQQVEEHARWLRRASAERLARSQVERLLERSGSPEAFLHDGAAIFSGAQQRCVTKQARSTGELAMDVFARLENPIPKGLPSGIDALDRVTRGWQPSRLYTIGARPAVGKTALAGTALLAIADALRIEHEHGIDNRQALFFSGEMPPTEIATRMLSQLAHVDSLRIDHGELNEDEFARLQTAAQKFSELPLLIEAPDTMDFDDMVAVAQVHHSRKRLAVVVFDYFGLMSKRGRWENRTRELDNISQGLKRLSRRLDVPVITLAQISRSGNDKPSKEHLRDSGSIEQDSDCVIIADREHLRRHEVSPSEMSLSIEKNRGGPTGFARVKYIPHETRVTDLDDAGGDSHGASEDGGRW